MKKISLALLASLFLSSSVFARGLLEGREGNGGGGILAGNKVSLYDLYLKNLEEVVPAEATDYITYSEIQSHLKLSHFDKATVQNLSLLLTQVAQLDSTIANSIVLAILSLDWVFVQADLQKLPYTDMTIAVPMENYIQLAIRQHSSVWLSEKYWHQLNATHKAALIIHEALYLLSEPNHNPDGNHVQSGSKTIELVGYLFQGIQNNSFDRNQFCLRFSDTWETSCEFSTQYDANPSFLYKKQLIQNFAVTFWNITDAHKDGWCLPPDFQLAVCEQYAVTLNLKDFSSKSTRELQALHNTFARNPNTVVNEKSQVLVNYSATPSQPEFIKWTNGNYTFLQLKFKHSDRAIFTQNKEQVYFFSQNEDGFTNFKNHFWKQFQYSRNSSFALRQLN